MATSLDFARELLAAGDRDLVVLKKCVVDSDIALEILGFHCQQAVEKYLKAALAAHQIEFRKIHDLKTLIDLAEDGGLSAPAHREKLEAVTPFAVEFRYRTLGMHGSPIERGEMVGIAAAARDWATGEVATVQARSG